MVNTEVSSFHTPQHLLGSKFKQVLQNSVWLACAMWQEEKFATVMIAVPNGPPGARVADRIFTDFLSSFLMSWFFDLLTI